MPKNLLPNCCLPKNILPVNSTVEAMGTLITKMAFITLKLSKLHSYHYLHLYIIYKKKNLFYADIDYGRSLTTLIDICYYQTQQCSIEYYLSTIHITQSLSTLQCLLDLHVIYIIFFGYFTLNQPCNNLFWPLHCLTF